MYLIGVPVVDGGGARAMRLTEGLQTYQVIFQKEVLEVSLIAKKNCMWQNMVKGRRQFDSTDVD